MDGIIYVTDMCNHRIQAFNSNGTFITTLPAGTYVIATETSDFMTSSVNVVVTAGTTSTVSISMTPSGTITGQVAATGSGAPISNVSVNAVSSQGMVVTAVTAADGTYELDGLDAGTYQIILGDPGTPGATQTTASLSPSAANGDGKSLHSCCGHSHGSSLCRRRLHSARRRHSRFGTVRERRNYPRAPMLMGTIRL